MAISNRKGGSERQNNLNGNIMNIDQILNAGGFRKLGASRQSRQFQHRELLNLFSSPRIL